MKRLALCVLAAVTLLTASPRKPKLILAIVFDQFRYDYLTRFRAEYKGGFDVLLSRGAVFTNARFIHFPTVTAVGHSTFLSGATPSVSGIVGNDWFDNDEGKHVTSVGDAATKLVGGSSGDGSSPRRLLVDTVGDELKLANGGASRVIGISLKDRAAILASGHMANTAYWFDIASGTFVTSTYYCAQLPAWAAEFNATRPADHYHGAVWLDHKLPESGRDLYSAMEKSPFGNELIERFAERALEAEQLGRHDATDLLAVSFSSHDYVGHEKGPYSPEEHEVSVRADQTLGKLLEAAGRQVGFENVLVVMTADHGVAPIPESGAGWKMPGGRMPPNSVRDAIQAALTGKYGEGSWVLGSWDLSIYLNRALIAQRGLDLVDVRRTAAAVASALPHMMRVYTYDQFALGQVNPDDTGTRMINSFSSRRSPDLAFLPEPYWVLSRAGTSHGTTFDYDTHVPLMFMGTGIRPGRYYASVAINDVAPTLAAILDVETPSGSSGRVLYEMFEP